MLNYTMPHITGIVFVFSTLLVLSFFFWHSQWGQQLILYIAMVKPTTFLFWIWEGGKPPLTLCCYAPLRGWTCRHSVFSGEGPAPLLHLMSFQVLGQSHRLFSYCWARSEEQPCSDAQGQDLKNQMERGYPSDWRFCKNIHINKIGKQYSVHLISFSIILNHLAQLLTLSLAVPFSSFLFTYLLLFLFYPQHKSIKQSNIKQNKSKWMTIMMINSCKRNPARLNMHVR